MAAKGASWNDDRGRYAWETIHFFSQFAAHAFLRPIARPQLSSAASRREQPELGWAFLLYLYFEDKSWTAALIACEMCGIPTGGWCESCDDPNRALCSDCECSGCECFACVQLHDEDVRAQLIALNKPNLKIALGYPSFFTLDSR